jgi:hypothetical protein
VEFKNVDDAKCARKNIAGRLYMDRTVEICYLNEDRYLNGDYTELA